MESSVEQQAPNPDAGEELQFGVVGRVIGLLVMLFMIPVCIYGTVDIATFVWDGGNLIEAFAMTCMLVFCLSIALLGGRTALNRLPKSEAWSFWAFRR